LGPPFLHKNIEMDWEQIVYIAGNQQEANTRPQGMFFEDILS